MSVTVHEKKRVFDGFFKIDRAIVSYDGEHGRVENAPFEVFERGDSAAVLLYDPKKKQVIFTEQFRFPTFEKGPGFLLEIAAGSIEAGETPEDCIRREVREELGYDILGLQFIAQFYPSPGGSSERIHLFFCTVRDADLKDPNAHGLAQAHEQVTKVVWDADDFRAAALNGQIQDAKTLIAALWFALPK